MSNSSIFSKWLKSAKDTIIAHRLHILGITLANLSGVIFTINNGIIQTMSLDFSEIMLFRGAIQVLFLSSVLQFNGFSIFPNIGEKPWKVRLLTIFQGNQNYLNFPKKSLFCKAYGGVDRH